MSIESDLDKLAGLGLITHISLWPTEAGAWQANFATSRSGEKFTVFTEATPSKALGELLANMVKRAPYETPHGKPRSTRLVASPPVAPRNVRDLI